MRKNKLVTVRFYEFDWEALRKMALAQKTTVSQIIRNLVRQEIDKKFPVANREDHNDTI